MSARNPEEGVASLRHESGASALQRALTAESASSLGRLGRAVEAALGRLATVPDRARAAAEYDCARLVWEYFVQREACGLIGHIAVIEAYRIPPAVLAKVGARPPSSSAT